MKIICTRFEVSTMRVSLIASLHTTLCSLTGKYELYGGLYLLHLLHLQNKIKLSRILVTMNNNIYRPRDDPCRAPETAVGNSDRLFCYTACKHTALQVTCIECIVQMPSRWVVAACHIP
jgi:hypothetical protein